MDVEVVMWYDDYTGKAAVMDLANKGVSPETTVRRALANGTKKGYGKPALIMQPSLAGVSGFGSFSRDFSDMKWVGIPTVEISAYVYVLAQVTRSQGVPLWVTVRDDDRNPMYEEWGYSGVVTSAIVLTGFCLACYAANFTKFYWHLRYTSGITTAKIFFVIDALANFMRLWYICINPFFVNKFAYTWTTMCSSTHMALSIICTLLLALKWRELLQRTKLHVTVFLDTFKWPFIIASTLIFLVELISSALRGHWFDISKLSLASWSFLIIMAFLVTTVLFVSGYQILSHLGTAIGSRRRVLQLSSTTILILCSGFFIFLWGLFQMIFLIRTFHLLKGSIKLTNIFVCIQFTCLFIASFLQNWAMPLPFGFTPSNSTTNKSSNISLKHSEASRKVSKASTRGPRDQDPEEGEESEHAPLHESSQSSEGEDGKSFGASRGDDANIAVNMNEMEGDQEEEEEPEYSNGHDEESTTTSSSS
jgi:hypothetical protein